MKWEEVKAFQFCDSVRDGTHDTPKPVKIGFKLVTGKHIKNGQINPEGAYCISEEDYNSINNRSQVELWDVLMSMIGTVGEVAVVKETPNYAIKNVALFKCGKNEIRGKWLAYYLQSPMARGKMLGEKKGSSQQFLSLKQLRSLDIPAPDERYMRSVIDILSAYDDLIENNRKQIRLLEEAARRLYKEWFVDFRFPGHEAVPLVDGVPEGWEKKTIGDLSCVLRRGISPKYNENGKYTVINQKCIRESVMDISEARQQEKAYPLELNLQDGDTVICSTGSGTLGRVGQVYGDYSDTTLDSHVTLVRANEEKKTQFLYSVIKYHQAYLMTRGKGSTNQQELYKDVIKEVEIIVPTDEVLSRFEDFMQSLHDKVRILRDQILLSTEARDRLLPKLMSGEVDV